MRDDLGDLPALPGPPARVVSLVPSLTEAVAAGAADLLVGATDYCVHPAGLAVARVGGSKYPSVDAVRAARPDLVLANVEENREADVAALRAAGVPVWVTYPRDVPASLDMLRRLFAVLGRPAPAWIDAAAAAWAALPPVGAPVPVVVPVWRRPWVAVGSGTFAGDVLARLGLRNVYGADPQRYPRPDAAALRAAGAALVVLPDEPYPFTADDGPEAFGGLPCALVSGRHLTWYGPSLVDAPRVLSTQLGQTVTGGMP
ncbi:MAG TPA: helical backbone metal receptor [Pilimelia sp.]|nr:helical backbone metal receptor [Pilimelia sp.]